MKDSGGWLQRSLVGVRLLDGCYRKDFLFSVAILKRICHSRRDPHNFTIQLNYQKHLFFTCILHCTSFLDFSTKMYHL